MHMEVEVRHGLCILRLKGRWLMGSDTDYQRARDELQNASCVRVLADFREVPYIDSTGLAFVVALHNLLRERGGKFVVAGASERVREVLSLTRVHEFIPVFSEEGAAIEELTGRRAMGAGGTFPSPCCA